MPPISSYNLLHSAPLGREMTEKLLALAAGHHDDAGSCHDLDHSCRVHNTALYIGGQLFAKLSKVKDKMLTLVGRQLATERHHFMDLFFSRLCREVKGEWA